MFLSTISRPCDSDNDVDGESRRRRCFSPHSQHAVPRAGQHAGCGGPEPVAELTPAGLTVATYPLRAGVTSLNGLGVNDLTTTAGDFAASFDLIVPARTPASATTSWPA
jgi:hypothetical protein